MSVILRRLQNNRFMEFGDLFDPSRGVPVVVVNSSRCSNCRVKR